MLVHVPDVLSTDQLAACRRMLDEAPWLDGRVTAGFQSALVKNNVQVAEHHPAARELGGMIISSLEQVPLFIAAAPFALAYVDLTEQRILSVQDPRRQSFGVRLLGWLRVLHSGGGLGLPWRTATCLTGLALPLLPVTGLTMWLIWQRNARALRSQNSIPLSAE